MPPGAPVAPSGQALSGAATAGRAPRPAVTRSRRRACLPPVLLEDALYITVRRRSVRRSRVRTRIRSVSVVTDHKGATAGEHRDHRTDPGSSTSRTNSGASDRRLRPLLAPHYRTPAPPHPALLPPGRASAGPATALAAPARLPATPRPGTTTPGTPPPGQPHPGSPRRATRPATQPAPPAGRSPRCGQPVPRTGAPPPSLRRRRGVSCSARPDREQAEDHRLDLPPADQGEPVQQPAHPPRRGA